MNKRLAATACLLFAISDFGPLFFSAPFSPFASFKTFAPFAVIDAASGPASLTNAQKLSLPVDTAVGTEVNVTDGFAVSGFGDARDGFWIYHIGTGYYHRASVVFLNDENDYICRYFAGDGWKFGTNNTSFDVLSDTDTANPWDATWTAAALTLTHPAHQQLAAPSSAITGEFVPGVGVFTKRGTNNGKDYYNLAGAADSTGNSVIRWTGDKWSIRDAGGSVTNESTDDVARPDLCTTWDVDPNMVALSTNTLTAGIKIPSGDYAGTYVVNGAVNGKLKYSDVLGALPDFTFDAGGGGVWNNQSIFSDSGDTATPALSTWSDPVTTVTADPVAAEGNWTNVP